MPYLSFSKDYHLAKTEGGCDLESLKTAQAKYNKLLGKYKDEVIHGAPTLDEAYYHFGPDEKSQENRQQRNRDQVVTKWPSYYDPQLHPQHCTLLRVNQLWVWVVNNSTLSTFFRHLL